MRGTVSELSSVCVRACLCACVCVPPPPSVSNHFCPTVSFLFSSTPHRADRERPTRTQWNGHWLLSESLWHSSWHPHPRPLWHTPHASQPPTHTPTSPRKPQLPPLNGAPFVWLWQHAGPPGSIEPANSPPLPPPDPPPPPRLCVYS